MLSGFNHNIRHLGILFHVQTEDQGTKNSIIVTHLFHGGNVIATRRSSYEKFTTKSSLKDIVLAIMQEQHKDMMKDLVHGRIQAVQKVLGLPDSKRQPVDTTYVKIPKPAQVPQSKPLPPRTRPSQPSSRDLRATPPKPLAPSSSRERRVPIRKNIPTLDTDSTADKSLDEMILEFLSTEKKN